LEGQTSARAAETGGDQGKYGGATQLACSARAVAAGAIRGAAALVYAVEEERRRLVNAVEEERWRTVDVVEEERRRMVDAVEEERQRTVNAVEEWRRTMDAVEEERRRLADAVEEKSGGAQVRTEERRTVERKKRKSPIDRLKNGDPLFKG
jgi:hypothetical protein